MASQMNAAQNMPPQNSRKPRKEKSPYLQILSYAEGRRFSFSAATARLTMSMLSLGIVLAMRMIYHDWTNAGTLSAVYVFFAAVCTPIYARCFDKFGQYITGRIALPLSSGALLVFVLALVFRAPLWSLYIFAIFLGLTQFSFGALARTRWTNLLRKEAADGKMSEEKASQLLSTAFAWEAAIDELIFIIGPIFATSLATSVNPTSQLILPLIAQTIGGAIFFTLQSAKAKPTALITETTSKPQSAEVNEQNDSAAQAAPAGSTIYRMDSDAPISDQQRLSRLSPRRWLRLRRSMKKNAPKLALGFPGMVTLFLTFIIYSSGFSAYDVSVVAMTQAHHIDAASGVYLAIYSAGSLVGAIIYGSRSWRMPLWSRLLTMMLLLALGFGLIDVCKDDLILFVPAAFIAGMVISPVFATVNMIVEDTVPGTFLTEGLSWLNTGSAVGNSIGSAAVGVVLDHFGYQWSFMMPWVSVLFAALFVMATHPSVVPELASYIRLRIRELRQVA
ncbi:MAG TPA: MFS transporter [Aeriscardovia aeriphila]|uniref:MFS transporter n=1 Tax=Aeriscardovia aeriphila TaxID=218139 RepID=A0A921FWJ4_9BIFI|nr:MFS transporter [Aeriscardovia aeriphila]